MKLLATYVGWQGDMNLFDPLTKKIVLADNKLEIRGFHAKRATYHSLEFNKPPRRGVVIMLDGSEVYLNNIQQVAVRHTTEGLMLEITHIVNLFDIYGAMTVQEETFDCLQADVRTLKVY